MKNLNNLIKSAYELNNDDKQQLLTLCNIWHKNRFRIDNVVGFENAYIDPTWTIDEYTSFLDKYNIEYMTMEKEKDNGNTLKIVIPQVMFKAMSSAERGKLIKSIVNA